MSAPAKPPLYLDLTFSNCRALLTATGIDLTTDAGVAAVFAALQARSPLVVGYSYVFAEDVLTVTIDWAAVTPLPDLGRLESVIVRHLGEGG